MTKHKKLNIKIELPAHEEYKPKEEVVYLWDRIVGAIIGLVLLVTITVGGSMYFFSANGDDDQQIASTVQIDARPTDTATTKTAEAESDVDDTQAQPIATATASLEQSTSNNDGNTIPQDARKIVLLREADQDDDLNTAQQNITKKPQPTTLAESVGDKPRRTAALIKPAKPQAETLTAATVKETKPEESDMENSSPMASVDTLPANPFKQTQRQVFSDNIKRFTLSKKVQDHEPVGSVGEVEFDENNIATIYAYADAVGLKDRVLYYRWSLNGKQIARVRVGVWSNRYRSYSSKFIQPHMQGDWKVELIDQKGNLLAMSQFQFTPESVTPE